MEKMTTTVHLARDTRGANLVEYILLVGLVAIVCLVGFEIFGSSVRQKVLDQTVTVQGI
jgi:pilus assembly protein Flp/PilA